MAEPAEAETLDRILQGDLDAFNDLIAAEQLRVYNLCLRMLGSPQAAEDATQEAFIAAYRSVRTLRGGNVRSWLMRIASNTCIDELRRRRRRPQMSLDATPEGEDEGAPMQVADLEAGPEELALRGEVGTALQAELLRLPDDQRLAVVLCDIEGLSYDEIAEAMSTSVGTVKSRISRGRARLREAVRARPELFGGLIRPTQGGR